MKGNFINETLIAFLIGFFLCYLTCVDNRKPTISILSNKDEVETIDSLNKKISNMNYEDLDRNLIHIGIISMDTSFIDTLMIHYGNHPGSYTIDSFSVKHIIRVKAI